MNLRDGLLRRAKGVPRRVIFPEGEDQRIIEASSRMALGRTAIPVVLASRQSCQASFPDLSLEGIEFIEPSEHPDAEALAHLYASRRKGVTGKMALRLMKRPLYLAGMLLSRGDVDAMIAGATKSTGQVVAAALLTVGLDDRISQPSSFFLMLLPGPPERLLVFADCALEVDPNPEELADITILTAGNTLRLLDLEPRIALLSFSTHGSAKHARVEKVKKTLEIIRTREPDLLVDGELQLDAALSPEVAQRKCPGSPLGGEANVLIFPDLDSGNIGYKLTQYLGGAQAVGPVTQGFRKPVNDLSRGASVEDIVLLAAISSIQAGMAG